ncbi:MAG: four helix bundle protein [Chloroflexi bacterium]|nr:four helix bundle protein [Chloroflexota bacterium]
MATIKRFEDIEAWQTARALANLNYSLSSADPFAKDYGLKDQIRRSAVSVMSNIAEGFELRTQPLVINYLGLAKASAGELRAQLYLALDLKYISQNQFSKAHELADKVSRQIYKFMRYLEQNKKAYNIREDRIEYNV